MHLKCLRNNINFLTLKTREILFQDILKILLKYNLNISLKKTINRKNESFYHIAMMAVCYNKSFCKKSRTEWKTKKRPRFKIRTSSALGYDT